METRKNIFLWCLYDFANSIISIVFFLYFAQWIVVDRNIPDIYFNLTFTIAALLLLLTVPLTGVMLDKYIRRISGIRYTTIFTALFYGISALSAISNNEYLALASFTLGLYSYLLSFTFYTPLINDISNQKNRGIVSGLGITSNYLGQFTGLLIALPFSTGIIKFFGGDNRAETLLPSVIIFVILSLPMLLYFKEPMKKGKESLFKATITGLKNIVPETKSMFSFKGVGLFLLSYFLFNDAILTAGNNFPIFLEQVWHVSDTIKTFILLGIVLMSAVGGILSGYVADRFGHKRTLVLILIGWIIILPVIGLLYNFTIFVIVSVMMGLWFGSSWTVSRSVMSCVAPKGKHNLAFAYFGLAERASSFIGPIVWGLTLSGLDYIGDAKYRYAVIIISVFVLLGLIALIKVKDDRSKHTFPEDLSF